MRFLIYHKMKKLLFIVLILSSFFTQSQIVNVENLRQATDTSRWSGYVRLDVNLTKNKNRIFNISNDIRIQYKKDKQLWLFINDIDFKEANATSLVSRNSQHLRYNYQFISRIVLEAFTQHQTDKISAIKNRFLIGSGLRFKLSQSEQYKFYFGSLVMYEYEHSETAISTYHNDWRNSSYVSFSLYPKSNISIVSTTYLQPRLDLINDYRISSQTSIALKVIKNLAYTATFTYQFDKFPVLGIPKEQYKLTNGLVYSF